MLHEHLNNENVIATNNNCTCSMNSHEREVLSFIIMMYILLIVSILFYFI